MTETVNAVTPEPTAPAAFVLPAALRNNLLTYLMSRPYAEVAGGVQELQTLQPLTTTTA